MAGIVLRASPLLELWLGTTACHREHVQGFVFYDFCSWASTHPPCQLCIPVHDDGAHVQLLAAGMVHSTLQHVRRVPRPRLGQEGGQRLRQVYTRFDSALACCSVLPPSDNLACSASTFAKLSLTLGFLGSVACALACRSRVTRGFGSDFDFNKWFTGSWITASCLELCCSASTSSPVKYPAAASECFLF